MIDSNERESYSFDNGEVAVCVGVVCGGWMRGDRNWQ